MLPRPATIAALLVTATLVAAGGCSVRDEQALTGGDARWWSATGAGSSGRDLIGGDSATAAGTSVIDYVDGFEAGSKRATDGLPMLIVFRAAWCRWSGELVQAVVADPQVMEQSRRFVCVTIDADRHVATCCEFKVRAFPTVILLDANRVEQFRATGATAVADLGSAMHAVLTAPPRPGRLAAKTSGSTR